MRGTRKVNMDLAEKFGMGGIVALIALMLLAAGGWIANVVKFVGLLGGDVTAMFIARIVGVFVAPLGSILGFL